MTNGYHNSPFVKWAETGPAAAARRWRRVVQPRRHQNDLVGRRVAPRTAASETTMHINVITLQIWWWGSGTQTNYLVLCFGSVRTWRMISFPLLWHIGETNLLELLHAYTQPKYYYILIYYLQGGPVSSVNLSNYKMVYKMNSDY